MLAVVKVQRIGRNNRRQSTLIERKRRERNRLRCNSCCVHGRSFGVPKSGKRSAQINERLISRVPASASRPRRHRLTPRRGNSASHRHSRKDVHFFAHRRTSPLLLVRWTRAEVSPVLNVKRLPGPCRGSTCFGQKQMSM